MASRSDLLPMLPVSRDRRPMLALVLVGLLGLVSLLLLFGPGQAPMVAAGAALVGLGAAAGVAVGRPRARAVSAGVDWSMLGASFGDALDAVVITDRDGVARVTSPAYAEAFGGAVSPLSIPLDHEQQARVGAAMRLALQAGEADVPALAMPGGARHLLLRRAGRADDHLVWRFRLTKAQDVIGTARALLVGEGGQRLGEAGVMGLLADRAGQLMAANRVFAARSLGDPAAEMAGRDLVQLLRVDDEGAVRFAREDDGLPPLRVVSVPLTDDRDFGASLFLLLDEDPDATNKASARNTATMHLHGLLAMLPLGLALLERGGHFLFMNNAFRRAAGVGQGDPMYPSDLVIDEDKGTVIDAIRRFAAGRALPGDLAIRLRQRPDEPVALTIANAKGLGDATVLLSLKDGSEESTLKRQVAQATKMQAVGQLAGGVAHDFNNILTAIIGHCDLMLVRHTPGDADYDDVQQIKHNSNRAAALTRQLLAFSRQQTLRPQILQLPDIISEVSNLLRRLLGERVRLEVKHGRTLGLIRADPGQLEQVIVNLAVNARDAMPGGGTLTMQTMAVTAADVRRMAHEILPVADYTALRVTDTGSGIAPEHLAKIFEPFFTTKEVGKGTGLGLSTVYGIVKQTDGFIFAESELGVGTSFVIYLPVQHAAVIEPAQPVRIEPSGDVWGTGTILLVEDEAMVRAVAERALSRQGYEVRTANNGEEALELLEEGVWIDLLISDVVMPTMDGPTLVRAARERFPNLPVLFMSGYAEEQLRQSIDIANVAFLPKPFSVQQLAHAARDVLAGEATR